MVLRKTKCFSDLKEHNCILIIQISKKIQLQIITKKVQDFRGTVSYLPSSTMKPKKLKMVVSLLSKPSEKVESDKQKYEKIVAKTKKLFKINN